MATIQATARTIANQARRVGYSVEEETAQTGTVYLTLRHPAWCRCAEKENCDGLCKTKVIRIADHDANEARYHFRVNRRPDLDCDPGYQAAAVFNLCRWIGVDPDRLAYLRRHNTLQRKRTEAAEAAAQAQAVRAAEDQAIYHQALEALSEESRATLLQYDEQHGRARKSFRKSRRYRRAVAELEDRMAMIRQGQ